MFITKRPLAGVVVGIVVVLLATAGCGTGDEPTTESRSSGPAEDETSESSPELRKVRFALPVPVPDAGQVWAYVPSSAGFFREEGLEVEFSTNQGAGDSLRRLASNEAEFAMVAPDPLFNAVGRGIDLRGVATVFTDQIYRIVTLDDSEIVDYADLNGKKIGVSNFTSAAYPFAQAALAEHGLAESDVEFVTVGVGAPALQALKSGQVDALSTWDTQIASFDNLGTAVRTLPPSDFQDFPDALITVRADLLESDPDLVARFSRAVLKGVAFAHREPEQAAEMYREEFPESASATPKEATVRVLKARLENLELEQDVQRGLGWIPVELYIELQERLLEVGSVENEQDVKALLTNELFEEFEIGAEN